MATVDTLSPGRNYTVLVSARNAIGQSANVTANTGYGPKKEEYTTPAPPQRGRTPYVSPVYVGLSASKSLHVLWEPPFDQRVDIEAYQVVVDDGATPVELPQTISPQYILTGLIPGTLHTFSVAARNREGAGEYSDTFAARTADDVPGKPLAPIPQYLVKGERHYIEVEMQPAPYSGAFNTSVLLYQLAEFVDGADQPSSLNYYNVSVDTMIETLPRNNARDYEFRERRSASSTGRSGRPRLRPQRLHARAVAAAERRSTRRPSPTTRSRSMDVDAIDKKAAAMASSSSRRRSRAIGRDPTAPDTLRVRVSGENCVPVGTKFLCRRRSRRAPRHAVRRRGVGREPGGPRPLLRGDRSRSPRRTRAADGPAEMVVASIHDGAQPLVGGADRQRREDPSCVLTSATTATRSTSPSTRRAGVHAGVAETEVARGDGGGRRELRRAQAAPDPEQLAPFTPLSYIVGGLAKGTSYVLNVSARALGASRIPACVCAPPLCDSAVEGCVSAPLPAHTYDDERARRAARADHRRLRGGGAEGVRDVHRAHAAVRPRPPPRRELEFSNATYALAPDTTGFNVSGLAPATQYGVRARSSNSLGWGDWSDLRFLSTSRCRRRRRRRSATRSGRRTTSSRQPARGGGVRPAADAVRVRIEVGSKVEELPTVIYRW